MKGWALLPVRSLGCVSLGQGGAKSVLIHPAAHRFPLPECSFSQRTPTHPQGPSPVSPLRSLSGQHPLQTSISATHHLQFLAPTVPVPLCSCHLFMHLSPLLDRSQEGGCLLWSPIPPAPGMQGVERLAVSDNSDRPPPPIVLKPPVSLPVIDLLG